MFNYNNCPTLNDKKSKRSTCQSRLVFIKNVMHMLDVDL